MIDYVADELSRVNSIETVSSFENEVFEDIYKWAFDINIEKLEKNERRIQYPSKEALIKAYWADKLG